MSFFHDASRSLSDQPTDLPGNILRAALVFEAGVGILAVGLGWLVGFAPLDLVRFDVADAGMGALASVPMIVVLLAGWRLSWKPIAGLREVVQSLIVPLFRGSSTLQLAFLSLAAGVGEELLFRGVIQAGLAERIGGPVGTYVALGASGLVFGLAHYVTRTYAILAGVVGVYLGTLMLYSENNLLVPMTAHAVYDFVALVYLVRIGDAKGPAG